MFDIQVRLLTPGCSLQGGRAWRGDGDGGEGVPAVVVLVPAAEVVLVARVEAGGARACIVDGGAVCCCPFIHRPGVDDTSVAPPALLRPVSNAGAPTPRLPRDGVSVPARCLACPALDIAKTVVPPPPSAVPAQLAPPASPPPLPTLPPCKGHCAFPSPVLPLCCYCGPEA
eukprot:365720-Chlamydomonas_euryale.AAC.17